MIEIVVREDIETPYVVRASGQLPQIHVNPAMNIGHIKKELGEKISTAEFQRFEKLWGDDSHPRQFLKEGEYLKIMDKE